MKFEEDEVNINRRVQGREGGIVYSEEMETE